MSGELLLLILDNLFLQLEPFFLPFDSFLLLVNYLLLFADSVDQHDVKLVVLYPFDLTALVVGDQQRLGQCDLFGDQTEIVFAGGFPVEGDWPQTL